MFRDIKDMPLKIIEYYLFLVQKYDIM